MVACMRRNWAIWAVIVVSWGCSNSGSRVDGERPPLDSGALIDGANGVDAIDAPLTRDGPPACTGCSANQVCVNGVCTDLPNQCPCPLESYCDLATSMCRPGCLADEQCV